MSKSKKTAIATAVDQVTVVDELVDAGEYGIHLVADIRPSPDNRKRFNEAALQELARSIKSDGVAQPILIRPVEPTAEHLESFEIVAGERRWRASRIAEVARIPALVRKMSDLQAAKIRILENLQREDPHPLEEAEGYEQLMLQHGYNADQLAEEIKKSRSYVYGRLKLCNLSQAVRGPFLDGAIEASTALLIARIPVPALQQRALDEIVNPPSYVSLEPLSCRRAAAHIQSRYMLDLAAAVFSITDGKLVADAGSCEKCPKRAGNQPEVFPDVDANLCTDPDCFGEKRAAHYAKTIARAEKDGIPIIEGAEGAALIQDSFHAVSDTVRNETPLMYLERNAPSTKNAGTVFGYLGKDKMPKPVSVVVHGNGATTAIYKRSDIQTALEACGACETVEQQAARLQAAESDPSPNQSDASPVSAKQLARAQAKLKKDQEDHLRREGRAARATSETEFRISLYRKLRQRGANGFSLQSLREFAKLMVRDDNNYSIPDDLIGDVYPFERATDDAVCAYIDQASLPEVQMILVDLVLGECLLVDSSDIDDLEESRTAGQFNCMLAMARHEGVDVYTTRIDIEMAKVQLADLADKDIGDFVRVNPNRLDELKDFFVAERPYMLSMLEAAALTHGYEYWQGKFIHVDARSSDGIQDASAVVSDDVDLGATDLAPTESIQAHAQDAEPITMPPAAEEAPAAQAPASKRKKPLAPAAAWPWPVKSADAEPATETVEVPPAPVQEDQPTAA